MTRKLIGCVRARCVSRGLFDNRIAFKGNPNLIDVKRKYLLVIVLLFGDTMQQ